VANAHLSTQFTKLSCYSSHRRSTTVSLFKTYPSIHRLIRCLLYEKQEKFSSFNVTDILLAKGDELNLILPKSARLVYFSLLFLSDFLALPQKYIVRRKYFAL